MSTFTCTIPSYCLCCGLRTSLRSLIRLSNSGNLQVPQSANRLTYWWLGSLVLWQTTLRKRLNYLQASLSYSRLACWCLQNSAPGRWKLWPLPVVFQIEHNLICSPNETLCHSPCLPELRAHKAPLWSVHLHMTWLGGRALFLGDCEEGGQAFLMNGLFSANWQERNRLRSWQCFPGWPEQNSGGGRLCSHPAGNVPHAAI